MQHSLFNILTTFFMWLCLFFFDHTLHVSFILHVVWWEWIPKWMSGMKGWWSIFADTGRAGRGVKGSLKQWSCFTSQHDCSSANSSFLVFFFWLKCMWLFSQSLLLGRNSSSSITVLYPKAFLFLGCHANTAPSLSYFIFLTLQEHYFLWDMIIEKQMGN